MWLLGLLLLPVIRWLHRGGRHRRTVPVSSLSLWDGAAASAPAAGERRPPDPAWRHRALLTALIFMALAEPQLPVQRTRVTLWVDDSLSMQTREAQGTRIVEGLAQAGRMLSEAGYAEVDVRALGDPWRSLGPLGDRTAAALAAKAGRKEPTPPPAALLRRDRLHWLITDGTDAALLDWPGGRRPDRVIEVAGIGRNAGLERVSARRSPSDPDRFDLLLKVTNGGNEAETREVVFITDGGESTRSRQRIEPRTSTLVTASVAATTRVQVRLVPGDALAEDDAIDLDLAPLSKRRVSIDSTCPGNVVAAVTSHPEFAVAAADATDVQAALDCGSRASANGLATVRIVADRVPTPLQGPLQWSASVSESSRISLAIGSMQTAARLQVRPADSVLLAAGDEPVIVMRRSGAAPLIETSLDLGSAGASRGPEIPLLVNLMFETVLGGPLLDRIAMVDRGPAAVLVASSSRTSAATQSLPVPVPAASSGKAASATEVYRDGAWPLLAVAMLVLLWEIVSLCRQWIRLNGSAGVAFE